MAWPSSAEPMLIGELAERTGTSERLPRYYDRAGLLRPERLPNGYRDYADSDTATVRRIRALLAAGLPSRIIRQVLPCTTGTATATARDQERDGGWVGSGTFGAGVAGADR
ncbi:MerR family transcriptional regulator [Streptomyces sp. NPDC051173]|uniref:MerR family transcriptional regulator n=1 Tax=Streptomyces sp. NPDC051173 TaxID=3155164 RepID=UPI00344D662F